jgi:hypothetical protein
MPSLSQLTLQLSRDLSANHQACLAELERLEAGRTAALDALPGTAAVMNRAREDRADAADTRDRTLHQIDVELQKADRKAAVAREAALRQIGNQLRTRDAAALEAKAAAEDKARAALDKEYAKIRASLDLTAQILARREAERRSADALQAARDAYLTTLNANRNRQTDEHRTALRKELTDSRAAREAAEIARQATNEVYQRALKVADTRLRAALETLEGAGAVQADFDERRRRVKLDARRREEALFDEFRRAKAALA